MQEISRQWWFGYFASLTAGLALIVLASWFFFPRAEAPPPPPPPQTAAELPALTADELFTRMRWSRENIRAFRMQERWEYLEFDREMPLDVPNPSGTVVSAGAGEWTQKGDYFRVIRHFDIAKTFRPRPIEERERRSGSGVRPDSPVGDKLDDALSNSVLSLEPKEEWVVFNGKHHAWYGGFNDDIQLTPIELLSEGMREAHRGTFPHPLKWGFAGEESRIPKLFEAHDRFEMTVAAIDTDTGPRYMLSRAPVSESSTTRYRLELQVDPGARLPRRQVDYLARGPQGQGPRNVVPAD